MTAFQRIDPLMSAAIAERQDWAADYRDALSPDILAMLDAILRERSAKP